MKTLSIDIETFSDVDLPKCGVFRYTESKAFEILLFSYSVDHATPVCIDLTKDLFLPAKIIKALTDPEVIKTAHNAAFEMRCISVFFGLELDPRQWRCTSIRAGVAGLPMSLEPAGAALGIANQKKAIGKTLIKKFTAPCAPKKSNGFKTRIRPADSPEDWALFMDYCNGDVLAEIDLLTGLPGFDLDPTENSMYRLDQLINRRGIQVDLTLVNKAIALSEQYSKNLSERQKKLTGLANPNSVKQLSEWLTVKLKTPVTSLTAKEVARLKKEHADNALVAEVLSIRQKTSQTSIKKYEAILNCVCADGRIYGMFQFYGANKTGRWAGRLVQVHNLKRNNLDNLTWVRTLLRNSPGAYDTLELCYPNVADVISQLIRTAFVAKPGYELIPADYSAIEACVLSWLAQEGWRLEVFRTHGKIYEASAAAMFGVPIESIDGDSPLRQKGKVSELALGYGGGPNALIQMGALEKGLKEEDLPPLVHAWRSSNKRIVKFWANVEKAVTDALKNPGKRVTLNTKTETGAVTLSFYVQSKWLFIVLPSGRRLSYYKPTILARDVIVRLANDEKMILRAGTIAYYSMNQITRKWQLTPSYGGKFVENITQAVARDVLVHAMLRLDKAGYNIVMHVHDEIVLEEKENTADIERINTIMSKPIPWAKDLPLKVKTFRSPFYKK